MIETAPLASSLADDAVLRAVLAYFSSRTGVKVAFEPGLGPGVAGTGARPSTCPILDAHGRCALTGGGADMAASTELPYFRPCLGGVGHVVVPVISREGGAPPREAGRVVSGPLAIRPTEYAEVLPVSRAISVHPDALAALLLQAPSVPGAEVAEFSNLVALVLRRVAAERADRARSLAVASAFEEVGMHGSRDVIRDLLAGLVRNFSDADAVILSTRASADGALEHQPAFATDLSAEERAPVMSFTAEVVGWIAQTGYPITFPDLGSSAWRRHVLGGQDLEGSLVAVPVKLPGDWRGWWTAYYRGPVAQMEDQLHRLALLAAHSAQTLAFVSALEASEEAAMTDALTGLGNRRFLHEQLDRELARSARGRYPVSMIIIDVDDFKEVNDVHGHRAGDAALTAVAAALQLPLRRSNTICRYGGDEFCVVLPECRTEEAARVAARLCEEVAGIRLDVAGDAPVGLRVSAGVATQDPSHPGGEELFELADQALISAKRAGKNQVLVHQRPAAAELSTEPGRLV